MKDVLGKLIFLGKFSWKLCPYYYFSKALDELISVITTFVYVFMPKLIIDSMVRGDEWKDVMKNLLFFIAALILCKLMDLLSRTYRNMITNRADVDTVKYYARLNAELGYEKFESAEVRDLLEVVMSKIRGNVAVDFIIIVLSALIQFGVYSAVLFNLNYWLLLIFLVVAVVRVKVKDIKNSIENDTISDLKRNARHFRYIDSTMVNFLFAKEVRTNNANELLESKYNENIKERNDLNISYNKRIFKANTLGIITDGIEMLALYGYAGYKALRAEITLGSFTMYIATVNRFMETVYGFINQLMDMKMTLTYVDKFYALESMVKENSIFNKDSKEKIEEPYVFEFCNVSFKYPNKQNYVLENINLKIMQGEKLSIVGENGAGKTTFVKLLCRLYRPTDGKILLNGVDISEIDTKEYAKLISVIFQDFKIFSFHVKDNIILNSKEDLVKLESVIEKADLGDKIRNVPDGIYTYVDKQFEEKGMEFSGGEQQKLALARAYYKDSALVIMDEPTAAMDPMAELKLYEKFNEIMEGKTVIFISHRLASAKFCDKIVVLENGMIVEQGTHHELMEIKGLYNKMFSIQMKLYAGKRTDVIVKNVVEQE